MKPEDDAHHVRTLSQAARAFFARPGPRMILGKVAASWAYRAKLGPIRKAEIPLALAVAAWWPLQEWLAHKHLLHLEPFEVGGTRIDPEFARAHRAHHREPRDIDNTLLPLAVLKSAIVANTALWSLLVRDRRLAATGRAVYSTAALVYEWTHFLVHTAYKPRSEFFARIRRNHRNHHYKNEGYWFGFTFPAVDAWLGTEPDPRSVPRSATARDLHGLGDVEDESA